MSNKENHYVVHHIAYVFPSQTVPWENTKKNQTNKYKKTEWVN
jgi:hypothetical protein